MTTYELSPHTINAHGHGRRTPSLVIEAEEEDVHVHKSPRYTRHSIDFLPENPGTLVPTFQTTDYSGERRLTVRSISIEDDDDDHTEFDETASRCAPDIDDELADIASASDASSGLHMLEPERCDTRRQRLSSVSVLRAQRRETQFSRRLSPGLKVRYMP